tara:strand:- start:87356 stop:92179 length:4824 start_codon:yes stop_codon:yes gene_type:complete
VHGVAEFDYNEENALHIQQTTQKTIINWDSFNIGENQLTEFHQPNNNAIAVNRIVGNSIDPTQILGTLIANGKILVLDGNGVFFGPDSHVDVGGLLASTGDIKDQDFITNDVITIYNAATHGAIINQGQINIKDAGIAAFVSPTIINNGYITAKLGHVVLAAGTQATLDLYGDGLLELALDQGQKQQIINAGHISADGGYIHIEAAAASDAVDNLIMNTGVIAANSVSVDETGQIHLYAQGSQNTASGASDTNLIVNDGLIEASGREVAAQGGDVILRGGAQSVVQVSGSIDVSGKTGGYIEVTGDKVALFDHAFLDGRGDNGGGDILIGGDYQGSGDTYTAQYTYISSESTIAADALLSGDGGKVIVWADDTTRYYGDISAQAGAQSGDGGFVEVSGKKSLLMRGGVDLTAANGTTGQLLVDPQDIYIVDAAAADDGATADAVFGTATSTDYTFSDDHIETLLTSANLTLQAERDIYVNEDIDTSAGNYALSLQADNNINLNADFNIDGALSLLADVDGVGGGGIVLSKDISITTTNDTILLNGSIDSDGTARDLTLAAGTGNIDFIGNVGSSSSLDVLTISSATDVSGDNADVSNSATASMDVNVLDVTAIGTVNLGAVEIQSDTVTDEISILAQNVILSGGLTDLDNGNIGTQIWVHNDLTINGDVNLSHETDFRAGGNIAFNANVTQRGGNYFRVLAGNHDFTGYDTSLDLTLNPNLTIPDGVRVFQDLGYETYLSLDTGTGKIDIDGVLESDVQMRMYRGDIELEDGSIIAHGNLFISNGRITTDASTGIDISVAGDLSFSYGYDVGDAANPLRISHTASGGTLTSGYPNQANLIITDNHYADVSVSGRIYMVAGDAVIIDNNGDTFENLWDTNLTSTLTLDTTTNGTNITFLPNICCGAAVNNTITIASAVLGGDFSVSGTDNIIIGTGAGAAIDASASTGTVFLGADIKNNNWQDSNGTGQVLMGDSGAYIDMGTSGDLILHAGSGIDVNTRGLTNLSVQSNSGNINIHNSVSGDMNIISANVSDVDGSNQLAISGVEILAATDGDDIVLRNDAGDITFSADMSYIYAGGAGNEGFVRLDAGYTAAQSGAGIAYGGGTINLGGAGLVLQANSGVGNHSGAELRTKNLSDLAAILSSGSVYINNDASSTRDIVIGTVNGVSGMTTNRSIVMTNSAPTDFIINEAISGSAFWSHSISTQGVLDINNTITGGGISLSAMAFDIDADIIHPGGGNKGALHFTQQGGLSLGIGSSASASSILDDTSLSHIGDGWFNDLKFIARNIIDIATASFSDNTVFQTTSNNANIELSGDISTTDDGGFEFINHGTGQTILGADIDSSASSGNIVFTDNVKLVGNRQISTGTGGGDIAFTAAVTADAASQNLTLIAGTGDIVFNADLGSTTTRFADIAINSTHDVTVANDSSIFATNYTQSAGTGLTSFGAPAAGYGIDVTNDLFVETESLTGKVHVGGSVKLNKNASLISLTGLVPSGDMDSSTDFSWTDSTDGVSTDTNFTFNSLVINSFVPPVISNGLDSLLSILDNVRATIFSFKALDIKAAQTKTSQSASTPSPTSSPLVTGDFDMDFEPLYELSVPQSPGNTGDED